MWTKVTLFIYF